MTNPVTLVCGHGRCGSSLVMQMLEAGGMPVTGSYPALEDPRAGMSDWDRDWIARQAGGAVKFLDPQVMPDERRLPDVPLRTIWVSRDPREQGKSTIKMMRVLAGLDLPASAWREMAGSYKADTLAALAILKVAGPVLRLSFEQIIRRPDVAARLISEFAGLPDWEAMAKAVRPRPVHCAPDMTMEIMLMKEREAAQAHVEAAE